MLSKAYDAQCVAVKVPCTNASELRQRNFTLFALALGSQLSVGVFDALCKSRYVISAGDVQ